MMQVGRRANELRRSCKVFFFGNYKPIRTQNMRVPVKLLALIGSLYKYLPKYIGCSIRTWQPSCNVALQMLTAAVQ